VAEVGYDALGFCEDSSNPFGALLELDLGAVVGLEAYKEVDGKKDVFFDQVLFSDYEVLELPDICLSFGEAPEGACIPDMDEEEMSIWWDNEVDPTDEEDEADDLAKRAVLEPRAKKRKKSKQWEYYSLDCDPRDKDADKHSKWPIKLKPYPKPKAIRAKKEAGNPVPIMKIGIDGCSDPATIEACMPDNWVVVKSTNENDMDGVTSWNSQCLFFLISPILGMRRN
jgi:hypothetical protein